MPILTTHDLAAALGGKTPFKDERPIAEVQVATLSEAFQRYCAPCPFKPGDIVTPRKGFGYSDAGHPHVVLEVADQPYRVFQPTDQMTVYSNCFGCKLDVRVANITRGGDVITFWQESWCLEPWTGEGRP